MNNERDSDQRERDLDAEAVASRSGAPIEHAKDAVEKTDGSGGNVEDATAEAKARNFDRRER